MSFDDDPWIASDLWAHDEYVLSIERTTSGELRGRITTPDDGVWMVSFPPDTGTQSAIEQLEFFVQCHNAGAPLPPNSERLTT